MNCQQAKPLMDACADGELDAAVIVEMEKHLNECPDCSLAWRNARALKKTLKQDALYFAAPNGLRQRVKAGFKSPVESMPWWPIWKWNWLTGAVATGATVCLAALLTMTLSRREEEQRLAHEIVSSHIRSLMADHKVDVASTDQHTVKPWFNGKLDFSPPVKDLKAREFPLIGGRLDYLGGHSVSALVFQRQKHIINLFIWPGSENNPKPSSLATIQGYNAIHWSDAGMVFWAVSDLNAKELMEFVQDYSSTGASITSH